MLNLEDFVSLVNEIEFERELPDTFLQYLMESDFFYAPAAKGHHDACDGGLYRHSKYMYESLLKINELFDGQYSKETLFLVAFGHDLCKVGMYKDKDQYYKEYDETAKREIWKTRPGYEIQDKFPVGHGEKSIIIMVQHGVQLTEEEMLAIRWHMGSFEVGVMLDPIVRGSYEAAQNLSPLVRITHCADLLAVTLSVKAENIAKKLEAESINGKGKIK